MFYFVWPNIAFGKTVQCTMYVYFVWTKVWHTLVISILAFVLHFSTILLKLASALVSLWSLWSPSKTQVNKPIFLLILWSLYFPAWFAFLFFFQSFLHSELGLKPFFSPANRRKQKKKNSPYTSYYYLKWLDVMLHRRWDRWK